LKVQHVPLNSAQLDVLGGTLRTNYSLRDLVLIDCGITFGKTLTTIIEFLSMHHGVLSRLCLDGNQLADNGIKALRVHCVLKLTQLSLAGTMVGYNGLRAFARWLCDRTSESKLENLTFDDNDLSETLRGLQVVPSFGTLCELVKCQGCTIKRLSLAKTRLSPAQLDMLMEALRRSPSVESVNLMHVCLPDEFKQPSTARNPLLCALADLQCPVKRFEVDAVNYPDLFRALWAAKCKRECNKFEAENHIACLGQGPLDSHNNGEIILSLADIHRFRIGRYLLRFGGKPNCLDVYTRHGCVSIADVGNKFSAVDVGKVIDAKLQFWKDWDQGRLGELVVKTFEVATTATSSYQRSTCVIYYRPAKESILMLRSHNTDAGKILLRRLQKGIIPDHFDTESRFPGVRCKFQTPRYTSEELLAGLKLDAFGDAEVTALANSDNASSFSEFCRGEAEISTWHSNLTERIGRLQQIQSLKQEFSAELRRRREHGCEVFPAGVLHFHSPSSHCKPMPGQADRRWFFRSLSRMVQASVGELFSSAVTVTSKAEGMLSDTCEDQSGRLHLLLTVVEVGEDLIDPKSEQELPLGFQPMPHHARYPPAWVSANHKDLKDSLQAYINDGFLHLPECVVRLITPDQAPRRARLARNSTHMRR
jgi:hypothetical protein